MPLPPHLEELEEETGVFGDIGAFIKYIESGQAEIDWNTCIRMRLRELEELF